MHVGETYTLEVSSRAGYATAAQAALVILGTAPAAIPLPPHGTLRISPAGMAFLPLLTIQPPTGMATLAVPIPNAPALVGLHLYWQALVVPSPDPSLARFTNLLDERIWGY